MALQLLGEEVGFKEEQEMEKNVNYSYKRDNHLNEWIAQFQAKESTTVPDEVMNLIRAEFKKRRIKDVSEITNSKVKEVLKKLRLNKYYEHSPYIATVLNGIKPPTMSQALEDRLRMMFNQVQAPFERHCPPDRKNFLSYSSSTSFASSSARMTTSSASLSSSQKRSCTSRIKSGKRSAVISSGNISQLYSMERLVTDLRKIIRRLLGFSNEFYVADAASHLEKALEAMEEGYRDPELWMKEQFEIGRVFQRLVPFAVIVLRRSSPEARRKYPTGAYMSESVSCMHRSKSVHF
jgi:hypothetical protein